MSGPITDANASPEFIPKTATATAIASSKLLLAAVNEMVAVTGYPAWAFLPKRKHNNKINTQGNGNSDNIKRYFYYVFTLKRKHNKNCEQEGNQS